MALERSSKMFLGVLLLLLAVGLGVLAFINTFGGGGDGEEGGEPVTVEIPEGAGATGVADILADAGVVRSSSGFRLAIRFDERAQRIQPGTYELRTGMGTDAVLEVITQPREAVEGFRVTIPEGLTVLETLERVANAEGSPFTMEVLEQGLAGVALPEWVPQDLPEGADPFEGLLFPNTYEFRVDSSAEDVLTRLIEETDAVMREITPPEGIDTYEVLVTASLIERETRVRDEQPIVASVIYNRLEEPMRLQIDATVIYARGEHTERVLREDTEIESLWNTYTQDGLPPTPISGAGRAAIEAAADPADTGHLYYVVCDTDTGEHAFAATLGDHNRNVARFRDIQDEGGRFCEEV